MGTRLERDSQTFTIRLPNDVVEKFEKSLEGTDTSLNQFIKLYMMSVSGSTRDQIASIHKSMRYQHTRLIQLTAMLKDLQEANDRLQSASEREAV